MECLEFRRDDAADAREKIRRGAVVDWHDDDTAQQTPPQGDDPLRTVLAPEDNPVAFSQAECMQAGRDAACGARDLRVGVGATSESVVVDEEEAARACEIVKKVDERVTGHG